LNTIFRQGQESPIVVNAHRIRQGEAPAFTTLDLSEAPSEFYFLERNSPEAVAATIVDLCTQIIPQRFGFDPVHDLQVLSPMHKGVIGTLNLNQLLQRELNPNSHVLQTPFGTFKIDDKVMHLKNNYQKEVFNGDIGTICSIDRSKNELLVDYYGRSVGYDLMETVELSLAYAVSVHKSQGSEYPAVIVPLMTQHYPLLQRNLLYTAITRAEKLVFLVGTQKALAIALHNNTPAKRLSSLDHRLRQDDSLWQYPDGL
jgi:exodeoxyribonuclease V alpha subunit